VRVIRNVFSDLKQGWFFTLPAGHTAYKKLKTVQKKPLKKSVAVSSLHYFPSSRRR
jgi:hypothetical protein